MTAILFEVPEAALPEGVNNATLRDGPDAAREIDFTKKLPA